MRVWVIVEVEWIECGVTGINANDVRELALKCLAAATADEVEDLVKNLSFSA